MDSDGCSRLALMTLVLAKRQGEALLDGLVPAARASCLQQMRRLMAASSAERQSALALAFGDAPDAGPRLRQVFRQANGALRMELWKGLPLYHRGVVGDVRLSVSGGAPNPLVSALARRMIQEATR